MAPIVHELATGLRFPEGPIAMPDGSIVLVEIERRCVSRVTPDGAVTSIARTGGGPNGAAIGPDGKCYVCNNGGLAWLESPRHGLRPGGPSNDYSGGRIERVDLATGTVERAVYEKQMLASPDQQISLTDPDSRSMATSGRGSGVVGYNVQVAVDTEHHLIVTHEVTNSGSDRAQLANMGKQAKAVLKTETLEAVADRGYFSSLEILACHEAGITVTLPKPQTSGAKSDGRFGKQDFVYLPEEDAYRCPAGEQLPYRFTSEEDGKRLRRYWTTACQDCSLKSQCTTGPERRIPRWEHEHLLEAVQQRLDANPKAMRQRRETVEHPFGTMKARMGATHFLTKTLPKVAAEMALSVLAYNLTRVMNIVGTKPLMAAIAA
jgi:Transposase DDE domain